MRGAISVFTSDSGGDEAPTTTVQNTEFQPNAVAVTKTGQLIEINEPAIYVYDNALTVTGSPPPARVVKGDDA